MSQTNDVYYSVEPYTGDIICHYKTAGAKNGYSHGVLVDPDKVAKSPKVKEYNFTGKKPNIIYEADISNKKNNSKAINSARKAYYDALGKYKKSNKQYYWDNKKNDYVESKEDKNKREEVERLERLYRALEKERPHNKVGSAIKDAYYKIKTKLTPTGSKGYTRVYSSYI